MASVRGKKTSSPRKNDPEKPQAQEMASVRGKKASSPRDGRWLLKSLKPKNG
uniref:Uncharacterized protein n=1 Tax=Picea glauca TaxID=3330 RepID=A0A101M467_PICGL|nr:hypothetical protein ABT39_MTgene605 [Picea glauca]